MKHILWCFAIKGSSCAISVGTKFTLAMEKGTAGWTGRYVSLIHNKVSVSHESDIALPVLRTTDYIVTCL